MFWSVLSLDDSTASAPNDLSWVPAPMEACVFTVMTLIPTEPATPTCFPFATPSPCDVKSFTLPLVSSAVTFTPCSGDDVGGADRGIVGHVGDIQ